MCKPPGLRACRVGLEAAVTVTVLVKATDPAGTAPRQRGPPPDATGSLAPELRGGTPWGVGGTRQSKNMCAQGRANARKREGAGQHKDAMQDEELNEPADQ